MNNFLPVASIIAISCLGTGLVFGWLSGMIANGGSRFLHNILFLALANGITGCLIFFLFKGVALMLFLGGVSAAFLAHVWFCHSIKKHLYF